MPRPPHETARCPLCLRALPGEDEPHPAALLEALQLAIAALLPPERFRRRDRPEDRGCWAWPAIERGLAYGPMRRRELAALVYGEAADVRQRERDCNALSGLLAGLVRKGRLRQLGAGWYALPGREAGLTVARRADLLRLLERRGGEPITVAAAADALDVERGRVNTWLLELRRAGHPIRSRALPRTPNRQVYWLEPARFAAHGRAAAS